MADIQDDLKDYTQEFIERIGESRAAGFGFVPLVGSGLSAPSGVPIIHEVRDYLRKCVAMALGLDHPQAWHPSGTNNATHPEVCRLDFHRFRRWLPGRDEWPHFGDPQIFERDPVDWEQRLFDVFNEIRQRRNRDRDGSQALPEADVFQEAYGASAEWRSVLLFLSRLRLKSRPELTREYTKSQDNINKLESAWKETTHKEHFGESHQSVRQTEEEPFPHTPSKTRVIQISGESLVIGVRDLSLLSQLINSKDTLLTAFKKKFSEPTEEKHNNEKESEDEHSITETTPKQEDNDAEETRKQVDQLTTLEFKQEPIEFTHLLTLGPPDLDIVDTFFLKVVQGKHPTLGHRMLARLAGPLRITTALTTNFDELLEQAFLETHNVFTVFDVHVETGLPSYRHLDHTNSLVKLHGGRFGLRADYSLDKPPSDDDLRHFVSYLAGTHIELSLWQQRKRNIPAKRHLLVVGLSGDDERIETMIREAAKRLTGLHVFWVAYRTEDKENAQRLLLRAFSELPDENPSTHFTILRHQFTGLLFLQCYQELTRSVPTSCAIFPSLPRLPVPPELMFDSPIRPHDQEKKEDPSRERTNGSRDTTLRVGQEESTDTDDHTKNEKQQQSAHHEKKQILQLNDYRNQVRNRILEAIERSKYEPGFRRVVFMHGARGAFFGASTAAAMAFDQELDNGRQCVWIDMDEISSCNDLFETILYTVARKAGIADWMPVLLQTDDSRLNNDRIEAAQLHEISRITNNPNRKWVIFINSRTAAGSNLWPTDTFDDKQRQYPNGWLDEDRRDDDGNSLPPAISLSRSEINRDPHGDEHDPTACGDAVIDLLDGLCGKDCPNVTVVFLCFDNGRFFHAIRRRLPEIPHPIKGNKNNALPGYPDTVTPNDIVDRAIEWTTEIDPNNKYDTVKARRQFLYSLCLTNRVRYPAMMWTWPFHATDKQTPNITNLSKQWISKLERHHVVRRKRGGFIWIHCDIRNALRIRLIEDENGEHHEPSLAELTPRIHHGLAEWYHRLYSAVQDPSPAFEVVYHRVKQIASILKTNESELNESRDRDVILRALGNARQVLEIAHPSMLAVGFSNSLCRRLQQIRSVHLDHLETLLAQSKWTEHPNAFDEIRHRMHVLRVSSFRLNRSVAREVGENVIAFRRHRELRAWQYVVRLARSAQPSDKIAERRKRRTLYVTQYKQVKKILTESGITDRELASEANGEATKRKKRRDANRNLFNRSSKSTSRGRKSYRPIPPQVHLESPRSWIESCNILGTLGIAIRSFKFSTEQFRRVYQLVALPEPLWPNDQEPDAIPEDEIKKGTDNRFDDMFASKAGKRSDFRKWLRRELPEHVCRHYGDEIGSELHTDCMRQILLGLTKTFERSQQHLQARGQVYLAVARRIEYGLSLPSDDRHKLGSVAQLKSSAAECFDRSRWCFILAKEVMARLYRDEQRFAITISAEVPQLGHVPKDDWAEWYDDRQRSETLESLSLAFAGDYERAKRRLNEAESTLAELRRNEDSMERAIIDLHRVEVLTQQATARLLDRPTVTVIRDKAGKDDGCHEFAVRFDLKEVSGLSELRDPLLASMHLPDGSQCLAEIYHNFMIALLPVARHADFVDEHNTEESDREARHGFHRRLRESLSYLDDAWQTLARAERLLKRHRKNVWWTTWFFELEMKVVELCLFSRLFERCISLKRPGKGNDRDQTQMTIRRFPFLGVDAVPLGTPTIADRLLDNAERMVRLDLFRISRISESYANCVFALALWRESLDRKSPLSDWAELGRRQKEMHAKLSDVKGFLKRRLDRRDDLDGQWATTALDHHVRAYIDIVCRHVDIVEKLALQGLWQFENHVGHSKDIDPE